MRPSRWMSVTVGVAVCVLVCGCAAPKIDFAKIQQPARAAELDEYNVFVGAWNWEGEVLNAEGANKKWSGTASWDWTLDGRCLHGQIAAKSEAAQFTAEGLWSWEPKCKKYVWSMYNNWGYPVQGTAKYDAAGKTWTMPYVGLGLDGTTSYGQYCMKVKDKDTLEWRLDEWMDALHMMKKMEMTATYTRAK